ncbi:MAG TPA: hypothetical protein VIG80_07820, partial [Bacillaceae bacterium]
VTKKDRERIMESLTVGKKRIFPLKYVTSLVAVAFIILLFFSPAILQDEETATSAVKKEIHEEFGHQLFFPHYNKYPVTSVELHSSPNDKKTVTFIYSKNKGDAVLPVNEREVQGDLKVLYGRYEGEQAFRISYMNRKLVPSNEEYVKQINGHEVEYERLEREEGQFILAALNVKEGGYFFEFILAKDFTQEDADQILDSFTKQLEN